MTASMAVSMAVLACVSGVPATVSAACAAPVFSVSSRDGIGAADTEGQGKAKGRSKGQSKGQSQGQSKGKRQAKAGPEDDARVAASIDRELCRRRVTAYYQRQGLPPGLAKRDSLPPGLEKQLRKRGQLPPGLEKHLSSLPPDLVRELTPLPDGYGWRLVGGDVVVLRLGGNVVAALIPGVVGSR